MHAARITAVLYWLSTMAWGQTSESALYNDAVARIRTGDWEGGCAIAARLAQSRPDFYAPHNLLGLCSVRKAEHAEAEAAFRKSVALNPRYADSRNNLGIELLRRGDRDGAIEQFAAALRTDPQNLTALRNLGRIHLDGDNPRQAVLLLKTALQLAPADLSLRLTFAEALATVGEEEQARNLLREDLRQRPSLGSEMLALARAASEQGRHASSRAILAALEASPALEPEWNALLGYAHYRLGNPKEAQQHMQRAIELEPKVEAHWLNLVELLLYYRSFDAAIAFLQSGLGALPESARLHLGMGVALLAAGEQDESGLRHLETALQILPDLEPAYAALCEARYRRKEWNDLEEATTRWLRRNPQAHQAYYYKALIQLESGAAEPDQAHAEAERRLTESIRLEPAFAPARMLMGVLQSRLGDETRALEEFRAASEADPDDPAAHYRLAMTYRKLGRTEMSQASLKTFQELKAKEQGPKIAFQLSSAP